VKRILDSAGSFLKNFRQMAWQNYCRLCNSVIDEDDRHFCGDCWRNLGVCIVDSHCLRCGKEISDFAKLPNGCPACFEQSFDFDSIACAGIYRPPLSNLIIKFKLADRTHLLTPLLNLAQQAVIRSSFSQAVDFVVPVPLHWRRRFQRGFNQSALIARGLNFNGARFNTDIVRVRYTQEQTALTAFARRKNVKGAFAVRKGHNFEGKNICLVDDVKTTGATLNECAKVLKNAGANKVFAFVLAVAGQKENTKGL
jgi:competence protein ComFC